MLFPTISLGEVVFTWYCVPNTLFPAISLGEVVFTWYCVPNTLFPAISLGEVAFTWYCVPNTLSPRNISWRSRLVWSRARDWKSRNRQKRFKSSNLFFSANT